LLPVPEKKIFFPHFFNITSVGKKLNSKSDLIPAPLQIFRVSAQKSIKIRQRFWESFEVGPNLEYYQIND
jgi:hypothetical protein